MRKTKVFSQWLSLAATVQACSNRVATKNDPRELNEHLSAESETIQKEYKRLKHIIEQLANDYEHSKEFDPFRRYRELKGMIKRCVLHLHIKVDESRDDLHNSKEFSYNLEIAKGREGKYSAMTKDELINENKMLRGQIRDFKRDCAIVRDCVLQLERNYTSSKQLSPYHRYRIMKLMVKKLYSELKQVYKNESTGQGLDIKEHNLTATGKSMMDMKSAEQKAWHSSNTVLITARRRLTIL